MNILFVNFLKNSFEMSSKHFDTDSLNEAFQSILLPSGKILFSNFLPR